MRHFFSNIIKTLIVIALSLSWLSFSITGAHAQQGKLKAFKSCMQSCRASRNNCSGSYKKCDAQFNRCAAGCQQILQHGQLPINNYADKKVARNTEQ